MMNLDQSLMYLLAAILIPLSFWGFMALKEKIFGKPKRKRRKK